MSQKSQSIPVHLLIMQAVHKLMLGKHLVASQLPHFVEPVHGVVVLSKAKLKTPSYGPFTIYPATQSDDLAPQEQLGNMHQNLPSISAK